MKMFALPALLLASALPAAASAADLPRKAGLGVSLDQKAGGGGAVVSQVLPGLTAEALGVRAGDAIVSAGGKPIEGASGLVDYAATLKGGDPVELVVRRAGKERRIRGKALPRPLERYEGARADYGAVPFRGGLLRDILVAPDGVSDAPVVFLIQGFSCATIEPNNAAHPYRRLGEELVARGIGYYRVEKPGLGDSAGTPQCSEIDFATELDAFRSAYRHLVEARGVDPDRIFMFGHSLGGLEAPLLAAEQAPRGVAAYGTVLKNWADYHQDLSAIQDYLTTGTDVGAAAAAADANRDIIRRFYFAREAPAAIAASAPKFDAPMRELLGWNGGTRTFGRDYRFMQDLAYQPIAAAWRKAKTNVLALYGESDVVALVDTDHRLIADIANWYRPGSGRYVEVPGTGHGMDKVGTRFELRERNAAGQDAPGEFNPAVAEVLAGWIRDSMARPPVRTLAERTRPAPPAPAGG
ncbi:MAG TPA: alpha/beta fold hydrolase [Allosphingosinicella sp.]|jgi:hypothetical protein